MAHTLLLFAHLADVCKSPTIQIEEQTTVAELRKQLALIVPSLAFESFAIAVNHVIVSDDYKLNAADEIALLPPFSGG